MGVAPNSPLTSSNTNSAFLDANNDDTGVGKITLANTDAVSGSSVTNLQREHNSIASFVGKALNAVYNALPSWSSIDIGTSFDSLKQRLEYISAAFNFSTGHDHSGAGKGAPIPATAVSSVRLKSDLVLGTDITGATGSSTDVSSLLIGQFESSGSTVEGLVTTAPYNKVSLKYATGDNTDISLFDDLGNQVYGRLTKSGAVWTLSYYVEIAGAETSYSFSTATDLKWYYPQLFNQITDTPVYSNLLNILSASPGGVKWFKYTVTHTQLQAAALTNDIALFSLPPRGFIDKVVLIPTVAFAGSGIATYQISVGISGALDKYSAAFDATAVVASNSGQVSVVNTFEDTSSATSIRIAATSTGANLDQSTSGTMTVLVIWSVMP